MFYVSKYMYVHIMFVDRVRRSSTTFTAIRIPVHMINIIILTWPLLICELLTCILMGNSAGSECISYRKRYWDIQIELPT